MSVYMGVYVYMCTCVCVNTHMYISSLSSYRPGSTDIPDPLSPLLPIIHRPW